MLANGDTTGYSFHGDFINGWDQNVLEDAVQNCLYSNGDGVVASCGVLRPSNDLNFARTCPQADDVVSEQIRGRLSSLPGCNPVKPADAATIAACGASAKTATINTVTGTSRISLSIATSMVATTNPATLSTATRILTISVNYATTLSNIVIPTSFPYQLNTATTSTIGTGQAFYTSVRSGRISSPNPTPAPSIQPQDSQFSGSPNFVPSPGQVPPSDFSMNRNNRGNGWTGVQQSRRSNGRIRKQARRLRANEG